MKYILLIYGDPALRDAMTEADMQAEMAAHSAYGKALTEASAYAGGEALYPATTATTVRVRDGKPLVTDGPFAETHETLGGFYIIDVPNLDDAIAWAAKLPAPGGSIEIRPVVIFD